MLMGTQWYLLFNIIAGASAIPQDLKYTTALLHLTRLGALAHADPAGAVPLTWSPGRSPPAAGPGTPASWPNTSDLRRADLISVTGIGALIAEATASGDYPLLLAATLSMILTVVLINRLVWRRLYRLAEEKYRME